MFRGLFVTGTDTDVGKTTVAAALMHRYRDSCALKYWKPVQTGIESSDDTDTVRRLGDCTESELCNDGIRLPRPLSPNLAAELSGTRIAIDDLTARVHHETNAGPRVRWIVEGAGGVLVPLNDSEFMIDLIGALGMPVLVASRSGLGTINHTLLTIEALRHRNLEIAGVVMIGERNPGNRHAIERFGYVNVLGEMPRFPALTAASLHQWVATEFDTKGLLAPCLK